jgi:hypothetical protein
VLSVNFERVARELWYLPEREGRFAREAIYARCGEWRKRKGKLQPFSMNHCAC